MFDLRISDRESVSLRISDKRECVLEFSAVSYPCGFLPFLPRQTPARV